MFDQNGIWRDETYGAPGPSGGATGALDLMNVMQSGQNYNQEHAAKMAFLLSKILADKNAGALMQTPYAAQATEMSPEDIQSAYANTPEMRFQNLYGQMTPDQQTDPEAMMRAGIMSGAEQPNAGLSASLKYADQERKDTNSKRAFVQRSIKTMMDNGVPMEKITAAFPPELLDSLGIDLAALGTGAAALPGEKAARLKAQTETENLLREPKKENIEAGTGLKKATTALTVTRNNWYPLIASAEASSLLSSAGHKDALTAATDLNASIKAQEAEGALTPQGRVDIQSKAARTVDTLRRMQADQDVQAEIKKGTPQGLIYERSMRALQAGIQYGSKVAQTAPTVKVAKPKAEAPTEDHPTFKTLEAFKAAFRADQKRDPKPTEIARAQQAGWIVP